jgi:hypothetical protein
MIGIALIEAMSAAGWSYDERSHGFELVGEAATWWVSWQQAADMLVAAERGKEVAAVEVQPTSRVVAEMLNGTANDL